MADSIASACSADNRGEEEGATRRGGEGDDEVGTPVRAPSASEGLSPFRTT